MHHRLEERSLGLERINGPKHMTHSSDWLANTLMLPTRMVPLEKLPVRLLHLKKQLGILANML